MHEQVKLDEAAFFLQKMASVQHVSPVEFRFYTSAFLAAGRSVAQYAREEAKVRGRQAWFDTFAAQAPLLAFFKDERDINIHEAPVQLRQSGTISVSATGFVVSAGSVAVQVTDAAGSIVFRSPPEAPPPLAPWAEPSTNTVRYRYAFTNWDGPEDVLMLSEKYLSELRRMVDDARASGVLA